MPDYADFNFEMWRGDTAIFDGVVTVSGAVVNITGCSLKFTGKRSLQDTDAAAVFQLTTGMGIVITDGPAGEFTATMPSSATSALIAQTNCFCDVQMVDTLGNVSTMATGMLMIRIDVTGTNT